MATFFFKCGVVCDDCSNCWAPCFLDILSKDRALDAVRKDWRRLAFLSPAKRNDWSIAKPAIAQSGQAIKLISDEDTIVEAIKFACAKGVGIYQLATSEAKQSKKIALEAVEMFGPNLQFADLSLRDDRDVVMKAIAWKGDNCSVPVAPGSCIKYASDRLKDDKDIVAAAIARDGSNLQYASDLLASNPRVKHDALCNMRNLNFAPDDWKDNKVVVSAAVKLCGANLMYASDEMKNTEAVVEVAFQQDPSSIKFASEEMQKKFSQDDALQGA